MCTYSLSEASAQQVASPTHQVASAQDPLGALLVHALLADASAEDAEQPPAHAPARPVEKISQVRSSQLVEMRSDECGATCGEAETCAPGPAAPHPKPPRYACHQLCN